MKKLFTLLVLMLTAIAVNAASYQVWVAGIQVNDANKDNITGPGISGKVSYYVPLNKLILNNATIKSDYKYGAIFFGSGKTENAEIGIAGTNTIEYTGTEDAIMFTTRKTNTFGTQTTTATLNIKCTGGANSGIYSQGNINFYHAGIINVTNNGKYGIYDANKEHKFSATNTTINITSSTSAIQGFTSFSLTDSHISTPKNGSFSASDKAIVNTSGTVQKNVVIKPGNAYKIWVAGEQVTTLNAKDVLGDGNVYYRDDFKDLYFKDGTTITAPTSKYVVEAEQDLGLIMLGSVKFVQNNGGFAAVALKGESSYYINSQSDVKSPKLTIKANGQPCIFVGEKVNLTSKHLAYDLSYTSSNAIAARSNTSLTLDGVEMNISGNSNSYPIGGFSSVTMSNCKATSPSGATYSTSDKCFKSGSSDVKGSLVISPDDYGLKVAGVKVNGLNCWAINGDTHVIYKPADKSLNLSSATITSTGENAIENLGSELTINIYGECKITTNKAGIYSNKKLKIAGGTSNASLDVTSSTTTSAPLNMAADLEIKDLTLKTSSGVYGIWGSTNALTLDNVKWTGQLTDASGLKGHICSFNKVTLSNSTLDLNFTGIYASKSTIIAVKGSNTINCSNGQGILFDGSSSLKSNIIGYSSDASLDITTKGGGYGGIMTGHTLAVADLKMNVKGVAYGFSGQGSNAERPVHFNNAMITATATATGWPGIRQINATFDEYSGFYGNGARYDYDKHCVCVNGVTQSTVEIRPVLSVNGKTVSASNANDVLGDGKVKYDAANKKMIFTGASVSSICNYGRDGLELVFNGKCTSNGYWELRGHTTVSGTGSYTANVSGNIGAVVRNSTLTFKSGTYSFNSTSASYMAVNGASGSSELVIEEGATVKATGVKGSIGDFAKITLNGVKVAEPQGASVGEYNSKKAIVDKSGNVIKAEVVICKLEEYPLFVAGKQVTSYNCDDILGDGKVEYSAGNNTLTLTNATINTTEEMGIGYIGEETLTIKLVGQNSLSASKIAVNIIGPASITGNGSGSLTCSVSAKDGMAIGALIALTIENCTLTATSPSGYAITGAYAGTLTINNATVNANGKLECIGGFKDIALTGCYVDSPSGAVIDGNASLNNMGVYIGSYTVKDQDVVIKSGSPKDTKAPTLPSNSKVEAEATHNSISLTWNAASDNETAASDLIYSIAYKSKYTSWTTVDITGKTTYTIEGLDSEEEYTISVSVTDASGNTANYDGLKVSTKANAIEGITADDIANGKVYNTSGVLVGKNYKGVVIKNGKKYILK